MAFGLVEVPIDARCAPKDRAFANMFVTPDLLPMLTHYQATSGSCPEVVETPQAMSSTPADEPAIIDTEPTEQPLPLLHPGKLALRNLVGQKDPHPVCLCCDHTQGTVLWSQTITAAKTPAPAPASIPSSSTAVPRPALDVPMPDLHSMAIAIQDGAARIALLEVHVAEQDGMEPPSLKVQDASAIEGLIFEPSQIQPEGPQTSDKIVDPDDPGNLVPEYNSDDMDVEVKVEPSVPDAKSQNPELDTGDSN
ncbi:hypothetical protein BDR07DRAFT_1479973 [Suillus spraguei]|nr:hypothetical protein BDR07DRAFT_1479973 [Suillus spraguei]